MLKTAWEWPAWNQVLALWNQEAPPEIGVIPFQVGIHHYDRPWFDLRDDRQALMSSPLNDTADHLLMVLPPKPRECLIAYQLYARCREREELDFAYDVLKPVLRMHGLDYAWPWWSGGAKYLLPSVSRTIDWAPSRDPRRQQAEWPDMVLAAAAEWRAIAEEWTLVRIPKYLDRHSPEYEEYARYCAAEEERFERAEYERLKRKYGE